MMFHTIIRVLFLTLIWQGAVNADNTLDIRVGLWNMGWEQNDAPSDSAISVPLKNRFKIDNTMAQEASIYGSLEDVSINMKYIASKSDDDSTLKKSNEFSKYAGQLGYSFEALDAYFRVIHAETEGVAEGYHPVTQQSAYVEYATELDVMDLVFYPKMGFFDKLIGIGYRSTKYTLPQSIYVIGGSTVTGKAIEPKMEWDAKFVTLSINNSKDLLEKMSKEDRSGYSFYIDLLAGYGIDVSAKSSVAEEAGVDSYIEKGTGSFAETDIGVVAFTKLGGSVLSGKVGYRYLEQTLETGDADIYIYAKANSVFSGAFANVGITF